MPTGDLFVVAKRVRHLDEPVAGTPPILRLGKQDVDGVQIQTPGLPCRQEAGAPGNTPLHGRRVLLVGEVQHLGLFGIIGAEMCDVSVCNEKTVILGLREHHHSCLGL